MREVVYGVSRVLRNPLRNGRPFKIPRYFGFAKNLLSSDGTFMPTRPHLSRRVALWRARRLAIEWCGHATLIPASEPPPSGYGLEEWEREGRWPPTPPSR